MTPEQTRLALLDGAMTLFKAARRRLDNDPKPENVEVYCDAYDVLLRRVAEVANADMADAKERMEPPEPGAAEPCFVGQGDGGVLGSVNRVVPSGGASGHSS